MTIHRVRLVYSTGGAEAFNDWLSQYLINLQPWSPRENQVPTISDSGEDTTEHYRGDLTFEWSEDKAIILDQIDGYLSAYCDWYQLGYHVCDHDEDDRDGCSWAGPNSEVRESSASIPDDVPILSQ